MRSVGSPTAWEHTTCQDGRFDRRFPLPKRGSGRTTLKPPTHIEAVHRDGSLPLGTDGDGMDYVLVISGDSRGQVWLLTGEGAMPVATDFGSWIEGDVLVDARWTLENRR